MRCRRRNEGGEPTGARTGDFGQGERCGLVAATSQGRMHGLRGGVIVAGLAFALAATPLTGCTASAVQSSTATGASTESGSTSSVASGTAISLVDASSQFTDRDLDASYDESGATRVELADSGSKVTGDGASVDGGTVTITESGTYVVSGSLSDGRIVVSAGEEDKVQVVLDGASVGSSSSAALVVTQADKVFLTLAQGSQNTLTASGADVESDYGNVEGAVFSKSDLTINGDGNLSVSSSQGHGIVCKDDLRLVDGIVDVSAAGHAIQANDSVRVNGGAWTLTAGTDGIHAENDEDSSKGYVYLAGGSLGITAGSDGIDAGSVLQVDGGSVSVAAQDDGLHAEYDLAINGGSVNVTQSYEGVEGARVSITGGETSVVSSDDGLNAAGDPTGPTGTTGVMSSTDSTSVTDLAQSGQAPSAPSGGMMGSDSSASILISGGRVVVNAEGDGIDSNGDLTITGGETYVSGPTGDGDGAIDYGDGATATISGGIVVAAGSAGMAEDFSTSSSQGSMLVAASGDAGDVVTLKDSGGETLASFSPAKSFACVLVSAPGVEAGQSYTLAVGATFTDVTMDGTTYSDVSGAVGGGAPQGGGDQTGPGQPGFAPGGSSTSGDAPDRSGAPLA